MVTVNMLLQIKIAIDRDRLADMEPYYMVYRSAIYHRSVYVKWKTTNQNVTLSNFFHLSAPGI